ncbi:MAG: YraN family protein [Gammaproteobacteria bacterium]|jgi:putative endonuclease
MTQTARQMIGENSENLACEYLQHQGLTLIERNYACKLGEIDLIMMDKQTLVFVEVRSRTKADAYDPIESITYSKQRRLLQTGEIYLQNKGWLDVYPCRFDVIGITYLTGQPEILWIKHAISG